MAKSVLLKSLVIMSSCSSLHVRVLLYVATENIFVTKEMHDEATTWTFISEKFPNPVVTIAISVLHI